MLQISFDEFHQEVVVSRQGELTERIPVTKIANIVEAAPKYKDEIQLCLLHKQGHLNFSMELFQKGVFARLVNELDLNVSSGHFWGMDEWVIADKEVSADHPLSFEKADRELCFDRIRPELRMPDSNLHFPKADTNAYRKSWDAGVRCVVMQGGQGDVKHWAFNDPPRRKAPDLDDPPPAEEYRKLATRVVDLHPLTIAQNARTSGGGNISLVPVRAVTVGPVETWKAEKVSIWHAGNHDNPFGQRLTAFMISKGIVNTAVPMSLLAEHPNVQFNYFRGGIGSCEVEMH